jgi:hypothetical protein
MADHKDAVIEHLVNEHGLSASTAGKVWAAFMANEPCLAKTFTDFQAALSG